MLNLETQLRSPSEFKSARLLPPAFDRMKAADFKTRSTTVRTKEFGTFARRPITNVVRRTNRRLINKFSGLPTSVEDSSVRCMARPSSASLPGAAPAGFLLHV
ncbi:MAG: hypothetical protein C0483_11260 [Pirellula sp.]|nr:hypothetical protein [Pirellula sp.]